jgi:hypothetical protein
MKIRLSMRMASNAWNFFFQRLEPSLLSGEIFSKVWKKMFQGLENATF